MVAASVVAVSAAPRATPQRISVTIPPPLARVLTKSLQFSSSDVTSVGRGSTVVKMLQAGESREVPVVGAIWCDVPLAFFLARARDIVAFKRVDEVKQIGVVGVPATPDDLAGMTLETQDIEDLRRCTLGECKVKLDETALQKFRHEIGWTTPQATDQANRLAREVIAQYVAAYQQVGNAGLIEYRDRETRVRVAEGTQALLNRALWLHEAAPGLRQYADAFPRDSFPYAEDVIYWSKEAFGMKPMVSATHMIVWNGPGGAADATILSKQIYASHYIEASLSISLLVGDGRAEHAGVFVVYVNRSLVDLLQGGLLGPFRRSVARSKTREGLVDHLEAVKKRIEADYKTAKAAGEPSPH
jgi:hypothetical protein